LPLVRRNVEQERGASAEKGASLDHVEGSEFAVVEQIQIESIGAGVLVGQGGIGQVEQTRGSAGGGVVNKLKKARAIGDGNG